LGHTPYLHSFPTRRSSDLHQGDQAVLYKYPLIQYKSIKNKPCIVCMDEGAEELYRLMNQPNLNIQLQEKKMALVVDEVQMKRFRSEEHTSELQSRENLVCR